MKSLLNIGLGIMASVMLVSCFDSNKPNYQYMPNMYEPVGYETYGEDEIFPNDQVALLPAEGSIPRGWMPYEYPDTNEGLELAKAELTNPLEVTLESLAQGKALYEIYCAVCHGTKGDGQGILMQREKILGIPSYADPGRNITEGGTYHVMMYGLNSMGSYASQTNELERWQITQHVMNLKAALTGEPLIAPKVATPENVEMEVESISVDNLSTADQTN
ncbi:MAG: cytochrome c [Flavobacteriaceae bacterium]|nr:cytochrome c [Flavobacteriaceae bacterium]